MAGAGDWGRSMNPRGKGWGGGWADYEGKREGGEARGRHFEGMPKGGRRWVLGRGQEVTRVRVRT